MTMDGVLKGIAESEEHVTKCNDWLLTVGSLNVSNYRDRNRKYTEFVYNALKHGFYASDASKITVSELESFCKTLISKNLTAYKFIHDNVMADKKFKNRNLNDKQYVNVLFRMYLLRAASASEKTSWANKIKVDKKSRAWVENGIVGSTECANRMKEIGLSVK